MCESFKRKERLCNVQMLMHLNERKRKKKRSVIGKARNPGRVAIPGTGKKCPRNMGWKKGSIGRNGRVAPLKPP